MKLQKTGYDSETFLANAALGMFDGIDSVLWCYGFAAIIFTGVLSVYLPLGLPIFLCGWAVLSIVVVVTSRAPVHMIGIDEQAVVILGSIALLLIEQFGEEAASPRGLATMLALMSSVSLVAALSFFLAARYRLAQLFELLPYPVICGYMAGIGWLLLDAGIMVALDTPISMELWALLQQPQNLYKLLICLGGGLFLLIFTARVERSWALPAASAILLLLFFGCSWIFELGVGDLRAAGWIFDIPKPEGGVFEHLSGIGPGDIDFGFIASVLPQFAIIVFLVMLGASMELSAMTAVNLKANMKSDDEFRGIGAGNLFCGVICCPPGSTDAVASLLYEDFGASSRWMPLASSAVCLLVAFSGGWFINYTPKVLIGATIFLFTLQLFYDWMYDNVRKFHASDYAIVCVILLTVIFFGFMQGILIGFLLTVLFFVVRYSMIPAIQDQYSLIDHRSSVERSLADDRLLEKHGGEALVYTLRGYLFFGTANTVRDSVRDSIVHGQYSLILLDMRRVTGVDISALNAFTQIRQICDAHEVRLLYACHEKENCERLVALEAVSYEDEKPMVYTNADYAIEHMEEILLLRHRKANTESSVRYHLHDILDDQEKVSRLLRVMVKIDCAEGDTLFRQGDPDTGFFVLESGYMSANIDTGRGYSHRVKKFSPGSVIGELSSYTFDGTRTASVVADTPAVLYYLNPESLGDDAIVHEIVARTLGVRMEYMNRRLMWELI